MPRKNDLILNQLTVFPWWIVLLIGTTVYIVIAYVVPVLPFKNMLVVAFTKGMASFSPLLLILFVAAASVSAFRQFRNARVLDQQTGLDSIRNLSWREFEGLVSETFRRKGFFVLENPGDGPDGGVDLRLRKDGRITFVQCKHWKAGRVGVKVVRELHGVMAAKNVPQGIVVTFGDFTKEAKDFAHGKPIKLMVGNQLAKLISDVQTGENIASGKQATPICPKCGSEMKLRVARKGHHAGEKFWGCSRFPHCHGILPNGS